VVAVDTPQTREVLGAAGRIVPDDAPALAAGLRDALAGLGPSRERTASAARRFDRALACDGVLEVYAALLPRTAPPRQAAGMRS
jgi:hypothetical protein